MRYFKCIDRCGQACPELIIGRIYKIPIKNVEGEYLLKRPNGAGAYGIQLFEEVDKCIKLLILGKKINPKELP